MDEIVGILSQPGAAAVIAILVLIILTGHLGWWVWSSQHEELREDRNFWRTRDQQREEDFARQLDLLGDLMDYIKDTQRRSPS